MTDLTYTIETREQIRPALIWAKGLIALGLNRGPVMLSVGRPRRTLEQNDRLWPMLRDVSRQVEWYGERLSPEAWKDLFTAVLKQQKAVPGIEGGVVMIGGHTSRMTIEQMSELIEYIECFGTERGVKWTEPAS